MSYYNMYYDRLYKEATKEDEMPIIPDRLRQLRQMKKLSREELAARSKISARQIHRLESESASNATRERTINQLAGALRVEPGVLIGELPMPEYATVARLEEGERVQVSALIEPEVRLAYDLIKRRYGVNPTAIFNLGPLLFTLLAEGSLAWRREKLKEVDEAAERLYDLGEGHLSFAHAAFYEEAAGYEDESIEKRDLFGTIADPGWSGYDKSTNNPFADYLREFERKIGDPNVIHLDPALLNLAGPMNRFPHHQVCMSELEEITGGSIEATEALRLGHTRIKDIPEELWAENADEQRRDWLKERHERWLEKQPEQRGDWLKERREQWLEPDPPGLTLADFFKSAGEETGQ